MIYIVGDLHGEVDFTTVGNKTFKDQGLPPPTSDDILIQVGDLGLIWDLESNIRPNELYLRKWFLGKPWRMITCGGNHENWDRVFKLPVVWVDWLNGFAYEYIKDRVYYALRGVVYTIEGKTFFFAGGAASHDAEYRTEGVSLWGELETMSQTERDTGRDALKEAGGNVDYVISHTGPNELLNLLMMFEGSDPTRHYFDNLITEGLKPKHWYFGHLHMDRTSKYRDINYSCLYKELRQLDEHEENTDECI